MGTGGRGLLPPPRPCRVVVPGATWRHVTRKGRATQNVINEKVTTEKGGGEDELQDVWGGGCTRKDGGRPVQRARGNGVGGSKYDHVLSAEPRQPRQTKHRQFSWSCCVCRTQTEHKQFSLSFCACRTQTILTVMLCVQNTSRTQSILTVILCVQNTVGRWRGHVHQRCRRLRVVTVAPAQSAVPAQSVTLLPVGQSVLTHHVFSGTRMDRR